ncbi:MAG: H-type lectin domain-containing protein [Chitinophagaceae bacterium]|nr:H-type lectin domain-containing protein [Chitinophagaceae bacterium]
MKKIILLFLAFMAFIPVMNAQQNVGINNNGEPIDPSAILDVASRSKGVLIPRMRTSDKLGISNPANGLLVYDADTKSFWYFESGWKEILNSSSSVTPTGPALGDLTGFYPSPTVAKIQNLDVAFGVPFDRQIMKWDLLNNRWESANDSLFLPYNVQSSSSTKLFGITNANVSNGATAVYGKTSVSGSGILPALSVGVWGDNNAGAGVLGTSNSNVGVYGYSVQNYGLYGFSGGAAYAGVYGTNLTSGDAMKGEIFSGGAAIHGKSNGIIGKAGWFELTNANNTDTVVKMRQDGLGLGLSVHNSNTSNTNTAMTVRHAGNGTALYAYSEGGMAGNFEVTTSSNISPAVKILNQGSGNTLMVDAYNVNGLSSGLVVNYSGIGYGIDVNPSNGKAANFANVNAANNNNMVTVSTNGTGRGISSVLSNSSNLAAAVYGSSSGNKGVEGIAQNYGVLGQSTGLTGGIGVLGQSHLNSGDGIGVKGISYSTVNTSGAVTGINLSSGVGVYAESQTGVAIIGTTSRPNGASIYGTNDAASGQAIRGAASGNDGISIYGEAGLSNSLSYAANFRNYNAVNTREVVHMETNGLNRTLTLQTTNAANTAEMIYGKNYGNGNMMTLQDGAGDTKVYINNAGNMGLDGALLVRGTKGIVRSSSGTQLRVELVSAIVPGQPLSHYDQFNSQIIKNFTFSTPFSTIPTVSLGNISSGGFLGLTPSIESVTTTGCQLVLRNYTPYDFTIVNTIVSLIAVGAE